MKVWCFKTKNFEVRLLATPCQDEPDWDFGTEEDKRDLLDDIKEERVAWFNACVEVAKRGQVVSRNHLGQCCYKSTQAFCSAHRGANPLTRNSSLMRALHGEKTVICHYFPGMVIEAIAEARRILKLETAKERNAKPSYLKLPLHKRPDMLLWLDSNRGRYIPRDFATSFADRSKDVSGISDEDWATLEAGPDAENDWYWEAWTRVTDNACVTDEKGVKHTVFQSEHGDVWLVPHGMIWNEGDSGDMYIWPDEVKDEDEEGDEVKDEDEEEDEAE